MKFDDFKRVEKMYKKLSKGIYDRHEMPKVYKLLPPEFQVNKPNKNERIAAVKAYYEQVFLPVLQQFLEQYGELTGRT